MLQDFKAFLRIQNLLLENLNLTLNESAKIANFIINTIEKYNKEMEGEKHKDGTLFVELEINTDLPNIEKIDIGEQENTLTIETNGKKQQIKIGRLLKQLLPNAHNEDIEALFYKIKEKIIKKFNVLNNYEFTIENDVVKWYEYCEENYYLESCMTKKYLINKGILNLYKYDDNIKILLIKNKKEIATADVYKLDVNTIIAQALVWYNTSLGKPFIDRLYVHKKLNYMDIYNIMALWAEKNNYAYKTSPLQGNKINNSSTQKIEYQISEDIIEKLEWLPYMDTLCYLDYNNKILINVKKNNVIELQNLEGTKIGNKEWHKYFKNIKEIEKYVKDKCIPKLIQSVMDNGGLNTPLRIRVA